jgi:hypothetical protein
MRNHKLLLSVSLLVITACTSPPSAAAGGVLVECERSPSVVGQCFVARGRLSLYNGTPGFRIWRVGTNQILGVVDSTGTKSEGPNALLPSSVWKLLKTDVSTTAIYGDYRVCPLTAAHLGQMQMVCIASADNLAVSHP